MPRPSIFKTLLVATILTTTLASARAEEVREPAPRDLVAELAAQKEKNAEETAALQKKLDEAYAELEKAREDRKNRTVTISLVSFLVGCAFATFLVMKSRSAQR
jgi:ABC-type nitrate/sulfonate/bicarbonate transport system substrate-binding protein